MKKIFTLSFSILMFSGVFAQKSNETKIPNNIGIDYNDYLNFNTRTSQCFYLDNWDSTAQAVFYSAGAGNGFVTGTNKYYTTGMFEFFDSEGNTDDFYLNSVTYWFAKLYAGDPTDSITFQVFSGDTSTGPTSLIYSTTKLISEVKAATANNFYELNLSGNNVLVSGSFFAGVYFPNAYKAAWGTAGQTQDTIAIMSTVPVGGNPAIKNTAYESWFDGSGNVNYTELAAGWGMPNLSLGIWPELCTVPSSDNDLLTYSFQGLNPAVNGVIGDSTILVTVPAGTVVSSLVATFTISDSAYLWVGSTPQVNGVTANDFTYPVTYTVEAEDGTTKNYIVTVDFLIGINTNVISSLNIAPNPVVEILNVNFNTSETFAVVSLTNIAGQIVYSETINNTNGVFTTSIDVNDFNSGVYFLQINTNEGNLVRKIVKK